MIIGFTGTRLGMSRRQKEGVIAFLDGCKEIKKVLHGGCLGSDMEFHKICLPHVTEVFPGHPKGDPEDTSMWGDFHDATLIHEPRPYFERNRAIVDNCDVLLATPHSNVKRGGTWYTINYAKKQDITIIIFNR